MARCFFAVWLCSCMLTGCGKAGPEIVEVEGTLTLDGKPLDKVIVEFWPDSDGPKSSGMTDAQGKFVLKTADGTRAGAVVSKHKVVLYDESIVKHAFLGRAGEDVDMTDGQKPRFLELYTSPTQTPLNIDITAEKKDVKLEVEAYKEE